MCTGHRIHTRTRLRKKVVRWSQFFALRRGAGGGRTYAAGASITPLMPTAAGPVAGGRPSEPCRERGSRQYAQGEAKVARKNAPRALKGLLRPQAVGRVEGAPAQRAFPSRHSCRRRRVGWPAAGRSSPAASAAAVSALRVRQKWRAKTRRARSKASRARGEHEGGGGEMEGDGSQLEAGGGGEAWREG